MRNLFIIFLTFLSFQIFAQVPKELQGYWQFKVDKPGDWNGFAVGQNYIEGFYAIYAIRQIDTDNNGKIRIALEGPDNVVYEFLDTEGANRRVKISSRKDTLLCTRFENDPDIDYSSVDNAPIVNTGWRNTKNLDETLVFDSGKITIGDERWHVKWFGKYKFNEEYRALGEKDGEHRLFYISPQLNTLKLVYNMKANYYSKEGEFPEVYAFLGNWYNPSANEWNYGFFENFAIINGKPHRYKAIKKTDDGYHITFENPTKKKPIDLHVQDGSLQIGNIKYNKVSKFLPDYKGQETSVFYDSKFQKIDTAYISGYLRNNTSKDPFAVEITDWTTGETEKYYGDIDEHGLFTAKVPLYNTTQAFMDWRRASYVDVLSPGECYFLYKDLSTGETIFYGENARFHNEIAKYADFSSKNNINPKTSAGWQAKYNYERSLKDTAFLNLKLAQLDSLKKIDDTYFLNKDLAAKSTYYIENYTKYRIAFDLMQKYFQLDRNNDERFSEQYMDIVKNRFFDKNIAPLSLTRDNFTFLNNYLDYLSYSNNKNVVYHSDMISKLLDKGIIKADDEMKSYAKKVSRADQQELNDMSNSDTTLVRQYNEMVAANEALILKYTKYHLFLVNNLVLYKEVLSPEISDLFYTRKVISNFNNTPVALDETILNEVLNAVSSDFYRNIITKKNNELLALASGSFKYTDNLKNTDHLKEAKDADKIIAEILAPHKGKVVYIDFWGTWCGPCIAEMEYAPAAKKAFEDKDVVFIYLANRTPKEAWQNFIKAKDLEGKNVYHYNLPAEQQSMVERRLEVPHFPTYMLFNKNGELVNKQAPRPSNLTGLTQEINKLL